MKRFLLIVLILCGSKIYAQSDGAFKTVSEKIQVAETARPASLIKGKSLYKEEYLNPILAEIKKTFEPEALRVLNTQLQFKLEYRQPPDNSTTVTRPGKENPHYKPLGKNEVVETHTNHRDPIPEKYSISGGDVEPLRAIEGVCFNLKQIIQDTPLSGPGPRRENQRLKALSTLLTELPKFALRYLNANGDSPARHQDNLAQIESMRKDLFGVLKTFDEETKTTESHTSSSKKHPPA